MLRAPAVQPRILRGYSCRGPEQHFYPTRLPPRSEPQDRASRDGLTPPLDIRAITAYCEDIAPDPGSCTLEMQGAAQDRSFLIRVGAVKALRPSKGQEPAGANFSHRDLSRRTGYPVRHIPY